MEVAPGGRVVHEHHATFRARAEPAEHAVGAARLLSRPGRAHGVIRTPVSRRRRTGVSSAARSDLRHGGGGRGGGCGGEAEGHEAGEDGGGDAAAHGSSIVRWMRRYGW